MKAILFTSIVYLLILALYPAQSLGQEVIEGEAVGDTIDHIILLPEKYIEKTIFFKRVALEGVNRRDDGTFCLNIGRPKWQDKGTSYYISCYSRLRFVLSRNLAVQIIDAGRGKFLKKEDEDYIHKPETVQLGFTIITSGDSLQAIVFEIAEEGYFGTRSVLTDDLRRSVLCAAMRGDSNSIEALAPTQETLNTKDENGKTPLMYAAECGHEKTVRSLIARGANIGAKSNQGKTALAYAREARRKEIIKILEKAGARE